MVEKLNFPLLLQQLYGDVRIRLDVGFRQFSLLPKFLVVIQNAIMSESKGNACRTHERVIIAIFLLVPLRGHSGMAHDAADILRQTEAHQVGRPRTFIHRQMAV